MTGCASPAAGIPVKTGKYLTGANGKCLIEGTESGYVKLVTDQATHQAALAHLVDALGRVSPDLRDQYIARRGQNTAVLVIRPVHLTGKAKRDFRPIQQRM